MAMVQMVVALILFVTFRDVRRHSVAFLKCTDVMVPAMGQEIRVHELLLVFRALSAPSHFYVAVCKLILFDHHCSRDLSFTDEISPSCLSLTF